MNRIAAPQVTSSRLLAAVVKAHDKAAIVPEVTIGDPLAEMRTDDPLPPLTRRIDALMFQGLQRTAIEIKISVADARRETPAKVAPWAAVTHRFVYVVPAGLIDVAPWWGAGLWWVADDGTVEVRQKAKVRAHPEPLPQHVVQALAYRARMSGIGAGS